MSERRLRRREPSQSIRDAEYTEDRSTPGSRRRRPRATDGITVAAIVISDRTAPALVGLEPRAYRALVAELGIPATRRRAPEAIGRRGWEAATRDPLGRVPRSRSSISRIATSLSSGGTASAVPFASLTPLAAPTGWFVTSGSSIFEESAEGLSTSADAWQRGLRCSSRIRGVRFGSRVATLPLSPL
jgi:hypothetical protein